MQKAQREEAPGVTEPRGSLCCVCKRMDKGLGKGGVDITLDTVSGAGCSLNVLPLVSVYISSGSDDITTIFSCVCICLCKQLNRAPLNHISGEACGFDLNQLMGVNRYQSLEAERDSSSFVLLQTCVFSPSLYVWSWFG